MKLRILVGLVVTAAPFCPPSEAQTNGLTPGTVISWGEQVIPYVQPGTRYQAIAGGDVHSLALTSDGTVVAWGLNVLGESTVPADLTGVVAIAAAGSRSLALRSDGTVVAWGAGEPDRRPRHRRRRVSRSGAQVRRDGRRLGRQF